MSQVLQGYALELRLQATSNEQTASLDNNWEKLLSILSVSRAQVPPPRRPSHSGAVVYYGGVNIYVCMCVPGGWVSITYLLLRS